MVGVVFRKVFRSHSPFLMFPRFTFKSCNSSLLSLTLTQYCLSLSVCELAYLDFKSFFFIIVIVYISIIFKHTNSFFYFYKFIILYLL